MSTSRSAGLTSQAQTSHQETTTLVKHSSRWTLLGSTVLRPGVGAYTPPSPPALISNTNLVSSSLIGTVPLKSNKCLVFAPSVLLPTG